MPGYAPGVGGALQGQANGHGQTLSPKEVGQAMIAGGFPKNQAIIAKGIAITTAESGRNWGASENSSNPDGGTNYGGWQIDSKNGISESCGQDPVCSSRFANRLSHGGTSWADWATSSSDPTPYMQDAAQAIQAGPIGTGGSLIGHVPVVSAAVDGAKGLANAVGVIATLFSDLFEPSFWVRVLKGVFGIALLYMGINGLSKALLGIDISGGKVAGKIAETAAML